MKIKTILSIVIFALLLQKQQAVAQEKQRWFTTGFGVSTQKHIDKGAANTLMQGNGKMLELSALWVGLKDRHNRISIEYSTNKMFPRTEDGIENYFMGKCYSGNITYTHLRPLKITKENSRLKLHIGSDLSSLYNFRMFQENYWGNNVYSFDFTLLSFDPGFQVAYRIGKKQDGKWSVNWNFNFALFGYTVRPNYIGMVKDEYNYMFTRSIKDGKITSLNNRRCIKSDLAVSYTLNNWNKILLGYRWRGAEITSGDNTISYAFHQLYFTTFFNF